MDDCVRRLKQHRETLNKILWDERITASRRMLAQVIALYLDAVSEEGRNLWKGVIQSVWISPGRTKWVDDGEEAVTPDADRVEAQSIQHMKSVFEELTREGQNRGVEASTVSGSQGRDTEVRSGVET